jgi:hypothetical protein
VHQVASPNFPTTSNIYTETVVTLASSASIIWLVALIITHAYISTGSARFCSPVKSENIMHAKIKL